MLVQKVKSLVKVGVLKEGMYPHQNLKILKVEMLEEVMLKDGKEGGTQFAGRKRVCGFLQSIL